MPKISIIIPTFNSEKYLKECIESAIKQTLKDIEIIIVDSISQDNTIPIIKKYMQQDKRIQFNQREKEFVGASRNAALKNATGEYIMFLDSDDELDINACEIAYNKITTDNTCQMVEFDYSTIEFAKINEQKSLSLYYEKYGDSFIFSKQIPEHLSSCIVAPWKRIYKSEFLKINNIEFSEDSFGEDVVFYWKALANLEKFSICNNSLYKYRKLTNAVGTGSISKRFKSNFLVFNKALEILKNSNKFNLYSSHFFAELIRNYKYWLNIIDEKNIIEYYEIMQKEFVKIQNNYLLNELLKDYPQELVFFKTTIEKKLFQYPAKKNKIFYILKYANLLYITILGLKIKIKGRK